MASLWSKRQSFFLPRNQRLSLVPVFVLTMMSNVPVTGGAEIQLKGEVDGNVSFLCPVDLRRPVEFLYFQRQNPLTYINGFHARKPLQNPWENTRMDKDNMTVHMYNLNVSHQGVYECFVEYNDRHHTDKTYVLSITANYRKPAITILSCNENHCLMTCSSHGGYPRSKITWNIPETQMMKEVNRSKLVEDPDTLTYNISSIIQFNCSLGEIEMISCSVGGVDSERLSVCAPKDPPGSSQNNIPVIIAVAAIVVVSCIIMAAVYRMWKAKKRREAANVNVEYKLVNGNEQENALREGEGAC
ncbi:uncharacterized protein LOC121519740 isoform X3 [Cheilinus undulatus]|uniref:uncharacterized protein LOC121519740 isoform X3 n=1 Tax=Cheilinus undulatus TaxID=241271 RepID=UPI001BD2A3A4|nr:uncharacterized protein LOC121519740 isoform X3 [Cheilinus undulatus]